jgi:16S rRNA C1402 N4-methylase RsmH
METRCLFAVPPDICAFAQQFVLRKTCQVLSQLGMSMQQIRRAERGWHQDETLELRAPVRASE